MSTPASIGKFIKEFSKETQSILQQVRAAIKQAAPEAEETISYGIPTFKMGINIVYFGGFKHHIGFYPTPDGIAAFKKIIAIRRRERLGKISTEQTNAIGFN